MHADECEAECGQAGGAATVESLLLRHRDQPKVQDMGRALLAELSR